MGNNKKKILTEEEKAAILAKREADRIKREEKEQKRAEKERKEQLMKRIKTTIIAASVVLAIALITLTSCIAPVIKTNKVGEGASDHFGVRDTEGNALYYVKMAVKGYGSVIILLDATTAPITVANFLKLVNEGFYDGLTFHRVMKGFMIQGGDPDANGTGGSDEDIIGEFKANGYDNDIQHLYGTISMARSNPYNSASSQFFICNADARASLDGLYAAFGYVIAGMSVIDEITEKTLKYTGENGMIFDIKDQAVIKSIVQITEKEALEYIQ